MQNWLEEEEKKNNGEVASGQLLIRLHNSFNDDTKEQPIPITMLLRKKRISPPFFPILPKKKKNV